MIRNSVSSFSEQFVVMIMGVAVVMLVATGAQAQPRPDAGALMQQQEQLQLQAPQRLPELEAEEVPPPLEIGEGQVVLVKEVRFSGALELVDEKELQALVAEAIGRELDFKGLKSLADRVTDYLKKQGWFLARGYLPRQDVTEGVIEIRILAGRLSRREPVRIVPGTEGIARIKPERILAVAERQLPAGEAVHEDRLNRAVLLIGDYPGLQARARLEPGEKSGESRVLLTVDEGPLFSFGAWGDNYGNRDTGREQGNLSLGLNDPLGFGDRFSLMGTFSSGMELYRIGYSLPLGSDGLRLDLNFADLTYDVVTEPGKTTDLEGDSRTLGGTLSYPWLRSRSSNAYVKLSYTDKDSTDRAVGQVLRDKVSRAFGLTLVGDHLDRFGGGGFTSCTVTLTMGNIDLGGPLGDDYDIEGGFGKLNARLMRLQNLPGNFSFYSGLTVQFAGNNLDSSEKFYLGGPSGIRAYPGSEAGGDSAALLTLELRYDLPLRFLPGDLQLQGFYDAGWVQLHHDTRSIPTATATGENSYTISGAGLGLVYSWSDRVRIGAAWAAKVGSNPGRSANGLDADGRSDDNRAWIQAMLKF